MIIILGLITSSFNLRKYDEVLRYIEEYEGILRKKYKLLREKKPFISYLRSHSSSYYVQSIKARTLETLGRVRDSLKSIDRFLSKNIATSPNSDIKIL